MVLPLYSVAFAATLGYLHTLFLFSVLPDMKQTTSLFCYLLFRK